MNCDDVERWCLEAPIADWDLNPPVELSRHLAGCASCRSRMAGLRALHGALGARLGRVVASPGFAERVLDRARSEPVPDAHRRAELQRQAREQYEFRLRRLRRRWREQWSELIPDLLGGVSLAGAMALVLPAHAARWLPASGLAWGGVHLTPELLASALVALGVGAFAVFLGRRVVA